eukprot:2211036-Prymnesium_polylepis.1
MAHSPAARGYFTHEWQVRRGTMAPAESPGVRVHQGSPLVPAGMTPPARDQPISMAAMTNSWNLHDATVRREQQQRIREEESRRMQAEADNAAREAAQQAHAEQQAQQERE